MDIEEAKVLKAQLESSILKLINDFQKITGANVDDIHLHVLSQTLAGDIDKRVDLVITI